MYWLNATSLLLDLSPEELYTLTCSHYYILTYQDTRLTVQCYTFHLVYYDCAYGQSNDYTA